ncbi:MAG: hypothetical protein V7785_17470 [Bermanella sp.]
MNKDIETSKQVQTADIRQGSTLKSCEFYVSDTFETFSDEFASVWGGY